MDRAECATAHRVRSVRSAASSVQLARLVLAGVFLVMNRSSVRFRQAAPFWLFSIIYRSRFRDVINFVDRVVDRVAYQGRWDASVSWLQSVIDGRVSVPPAHGRPCTQPAASRVPWQASRLRQLGSSVRSASCASPHTRSSATLFRGVQRAAGVTRRPLCAPADTHGGHWRPPRMVSRSVATSSTGARKYGSFGAPGLGPDSASRCSAPSAASAAHPPGAEAGRTAQESSMSLSPSTSSYLLPFQC